MFHVARHAARADVDALDREDLEPPVPPEINRPAIALRIVLISVVAIVAGVIALLGGFQRDPTTSGGPPVAKLGEKVVAGIWTVSVDKVAMGSELHGEKAEKGFLIEIDISLENNGDRSRFAYGVVRPVTEGLKKFDDGNFISLRDEKLNPYIQPGLPEKYAIVWEVAEGTPRPTELKIEIVGIHPRPAFLGLLNDNFDAESIDGVLTVPVRSS